MKFIKPGLLAFFCGILLAGLHALVRDVIEDNQRHHEQQLLRELVAGVTLNPELTRTERGYQVHQDGKLAALIAQTQTDKGYNGRIELFVARNLDGEVIRVRVIQHRETPGLGDRIDHQVSNWIAGFNHRSRTNTDWRLAPEGDIDVITGATITSRAVSDAVLKVLPE